MPIAFNCSCGERIEVDDQLAGRQARCPYCQAVVRVPAAAPPPAKRARPVEPEDTDDDRGAFSGSLNPLDARNRPSSRRRRDDDEDEDRPSRRRDEEDDEDDRPSRRKRAAYDDEEDDDDRPRRRRRRHEPPPYNLFNNQTIAGSIAIVLSVTIMGVALFFDFCWYGLLFFTVAGFIALIRGLVSGRNG